MEESEMKDSLTLREGVRDSYTFSHSLMSFSHPYTVYSIEMTVGDFEGVRLMRSVSNFAKSKREKFTM